MDSISVNRNLSAGNELANKKYVDESLGSGNILGVNQNLEIYIKVFVGKDVYKLTKNDNIQITDATIKYPNSGGFLLQRWNRKCNDKNKNGKIQKFIRPTKKSSP